MRIYRIKTQEPGTSTNFIHMGNDFPTVNTSSKIKILGIMIHVLYIIYFYSQV